MKAIVYHIVRGCGELPTYGHHPGTAIVLMHIAAFTAAVGWQGFFVSCLIFLPIYFWGAYELSIEDK